MPLLLPRLQRMEEGDGERSPTPFSALEQLPGLTTVPAVWRRKLGETFDWFRPFLRPRPELAAGYPCDLCGCNHEIFVEPSTHSATAVCVKPQTCS